jgi:hypothetical protein
MKSLRFPVKGVGGFNLTVSEVFGVMVVIVSGIVSSCYRCRYRLYQGFISQYQGIGCCQSIEVSSIIESKFRGIGWSGFRGIKVSGCAVKILVRSLVSSHFC